MKIEDLIHLLDNRLREFQLSRDYARMSGNLERMNVADKEVLALEDTLYKLNLLVDTSKSAAVKEATLADVITDGSVAVLGDYDITSYATDPLHEEKVMNILSRMGVMDTVEKIDEYIKGKYFSSPVTGEMVMSAALAYDVDTRLMMAIMEQDSRFGTAGLAVRTLNPGNVGNDDGGNTRTYESWQEGVTAVAEWLSRHRGSTIVPETPLETAVEPTATSTPITATTTPSTATSTPLFTPSATTTPVITISTTTIATTTPVIATTTPVTATSTPITTTTPVTATTTPTTATSTPITATTTPATATTTPVTAGSTGSPQATSTPITATTTPSTATSTPLFTPSATTTPVVTTSTTTTATSTPATAPVTATDTTPVTAASTSSGQATSTPPAATAMPVTATTTPVTATPAEWQATTTEETAAATSN